MNKTGDIFWDEQHVADKETLLARLQVEAQKRPQPEVHIRGDQLTHYAAIDEVISTTNKRVLAKLHLSQLHLVHLNQMIRS